MSIPHEVKLTEHNYARGRPLPTPELVVFHWWGDPSKYRLPYAHEGVVRYFCTDRDPGSSAHAVVSYLRRTQVVLDKDTAYHAGNWDVNQRSLGIEIMPWDDLTPSDQVRGTFQAAAEQIAVWRTRYPGLVYTLHKDVSRTGTSCPGRWGPLAPLIWDHSSVLLPYVQSDFSVSPDAPLYEGNFTMYSPIEGRVTSTYGPRTINGVKSYHAGMDFAAPLGSPVRAAFDGIAHVVVSGRAPRQSASSGRVLAPYRSGNGVRIKGYVAGEELYGHVNPVVKQGQAVKAGQIIGHIDLSGITTGPHLHFETWARVGDQGSHMDPKTVFSKYGVAPGSATPGAAATGGSFAVPLKTIQTRLQATVNPKTGEAFYPAPLRLDGLGGPGSKTDAGIRAWQTFRGLVSDGQWGGISEADWELWEAHVRKVHAKLVTAGYNPGLDDGLFGPLMFNTVKAFQTKYGLYVDGQWGPKTDATWTKVTAPAPAPVFVPEKEEVPVPVPAPTPTPSVPSPGNEEALQVTLPGGTLTVSLKFTPKE